MSKILYKDTIPYETPSSLDALRGPASGLIELPLDVYWGPRRLFDLDNPNDLVAAYQALVREGTADVHAALLNEHLLHNVWSHLVLPERCRHLWESRFSELAA